MTALRCAVAIPARNEAALIGRCLAALARQIGAPRFGVVVVANNCDDATAEIAGRKRGLEVQVVEANFAPSDRHAGQARRVAMARAAELADIVLTTDADCVPDPDWVATHLAAFATGVDVVAGQVSGDWEELRHQPEAALRIGGLEWEYLGLIGEAEPLFDPRQHDPSPRHAQRCGANLAITATMLDAVGGVPAIPVGEDRALLAAVERADGLIRFDCGPHVTASARLDGRAAGGMAEALSARLSADYRCDDQFEPAETLIRRWRTRHAARAAWWSGARGVTIGTDRIDFDRTIPTFGAAWAGIEQRTPSLHPIRIVPDQLPAEIDRLRSIIAHHG